MNKERLHELNRDIARAGIAMQDELKRQFPEGSQVFVKLNCRQRTPTSGIVRAWSHDGYVCVGIDSANKRSRHNVRNVFYKNIVDVTCV